MKAKCSRCGSTIRQFTIVTKLGRKRQVWASLIKGEWSEACPATLLMERKHKS